MEILLYSALWAVLYLLIGYLYTCLHLVIWGFSGLCYVGMYILLWPIYLVTSILTVPLFVLENLLYKMFVYIGYIFLGAEYANELVDEFERKFDKAFQEEFDRRVVTGKLTSQDLKAPSKGTDRQR